MELLELINKHSGEDIYILGNSIQLNDLTEQQIETLKTKVTIGINYAFYIINPTYLISGHPVTFLDENMGPTIKILQSAVFDKGVHELNMDFFKDVIFVQSINILNNLPNITDAILKTTVLMGSENTTFSATHIAYLMGAKRIIYIGCDFSGKVHFYHTNEPVRNKMANEIHRLTRLYNMDIEYNNNFKQRYASALISLEFLHNLNEIAFLASVSVEALIKASFGGDFTAEFAEIFKLLKNNNVEPISTNKSSMLCGAGAKLIKLNEML